MYTLCVYKKKNCIRRKLFRLQFQLSSYMFKKGLNTVAVSSVVKEHGSHDMFPNWKVRGILSERDKLCHDCFQPYSSG